MSAALGRSTAMQCIPGCCLGTTVKIEHIALAVLGAHATITAKYTTSRGRYSEQCVQAHDGHELISEMTLGFVTISRVGYIKKCVRPNAVKA